MEGTRKETLKEGEKERRTWHSFASDRAWYWKEKVQNERYVRTKGGLGGRKN